MFTYSVMHEQEGMIQPSVAAKCAKMDILLQQIAASYLLAYAAQVILGFHVEALASCWSGIIAEWMSRIQCQCSGGTQGRI